MAKSLDFQAPYPCDEAHAVHPGEIEDTKSGTIAILVTAASRVPESSPGAAKGSKGTNGD